MRTKKRRGSLSWQTAAEVNVANYQVQRSEDGKTFIPNLA